MANHPEITLLGHPFAPIGMGEHVRSAHRAWSAAAVPTKVLDIYRMNTPDADVAAELDPHLADRLSGDIQIFHINGDEVAQALPHLAPRTDKRGYRIIYPAWELSRYPAEWAAELERFDEVWAPSHFIYESIRTATHMPVRHMPLACEVQITSFLGRRYFGIPEATFAFMFFFDFASYSERKNPLGAIQAFERFLQRNPSAQATMVIKLNGSTARPDAYAAFNERIAAFRQSITLIDRVMSDNEIKNLIRCCDCFLSLHRSEGFGRGLSESMALAKPVIATGYSGNLDFMDPTNALLVDFSLVDVAPNSYPQWQGQVWADPDIDHAARHMASVYADPALAERIGRKARLDIARGFSYRSIGLRYRSRLEELAQSGALGEAAPA